PPGHALGPPPYVASFPTRRSSDLLGEQVLLGREAVGGDGGGVEGGVGVLQGVAAGELQRAVDGPQTALDLRQRLGPHPPHLPARDRKSTRLNSSHSQISYAVFCLK